jgi:2-polyprenyl-6-methoxyphenol hydroxylase-like FAD-dependent oxidoreductase
MAKIERILIVGGGIAGLTAAIALRQRGFSPDHRDSGADGPPRWASFDPTATPRFESCGRPAWRASGRF